MKTSVFSPLSPLDVLNEESEFSTGQPLVSHRLLGSPVLPRLPLSPVPRCLIYTAFKCLQGWGLYHWRELLGSLCRGWTAPPRRHFPYIQPKHSLAQFEAVPSCPVTCSLEAEPIPLPMLYWDRTVAKSSSLKLQLTQELLPISLFPESAAEGEPCPCGSIPAGVGCWLQAPVSLPEPAVGFVLTEQTNSYPPEQPSAVVMKLPCMQLSDSSFPGAAKTPGRLCLTVGFSCSIKITNKKNSSMSNKIRCCCLCPLEMLSLLNSPPVTSVISISTLGLDPTKLVPGGNFYEDVNKTSRIMVVVLLLWCLYTVHKGHTEGDLF